MPKSLARDFSPGSRRFHAYCKPCRAGIERERRLSPAAIASHRESYQTNNFYRAQCLVAAIKKRAKRQGIPCDLTPEWLEERLNAGICELTAIPFNFSLEQRGLSPSVDRIKAGRGYLRKNCRVILLSINIALGNRGLDYFLPIADALVRLNYRPLAETGKKPL